MFRVKTNTGLFAWVSVNYIQAVVPGPTLGTTMLLMRDQASLLVDGVAEEIGQSIAMMLAGVIPLADLSEHKA